MPNLQAIVDRGRLPLNDAAKTRWTDATLLVFANDFLKMAKRERSDLFFGAFSVAWVDYALGDNYPLSVEFEPACADYITGRAESLGTEDELEQRALAFLQASVKGLGA